MVAALLIVICGVAYYFFMPVAEVATVHRGTAISAVYGTVRIEPAFGRKIPGSSNWLKNFPPAAARSAKV